MNRPASQPRGMGKDIQAMGAQEQGADATHGRWMVLPRTLCFVTNGADVLLLKRAATKRVFPNRYNGVGGHLERDEDPYAGARREVLEETGLDVTDLRLVGLHNIDAGSPSGILLFVFRATSARRDFVDSHEGALEWVPVDRLDSVDLVDDLTIILPRVLDAGPADAPYSAHVDYDERDQIRIVFNDA